MASNRALTDFQQHYHYIKHTHIAHSCEHAIICYKDNIKYSFVCMSKMYAPNEKENE